MSRFERAYLIAVLEGRDDPESAEVLWAISSDAKTSRAVERDLERLTAEGVVERTEHSTYCGECGSDSGVEHRYKLRPKKDWNIGSTDHD